MYATYDPATQQGRIRLLISDIDVLSPLFSDAEIDAFMALEDGDVYRAAAAALRAIAGNEVQVQKRIRLLDLTTDGPAEAAALRSLAADYDARADAGGDIEIADGAPGVFAHRRRVLDGLDY